MTTDQDTRVERTQRRLLGIALAATTALVSGVAVFVNSYGVRRFDDATTYTTAKNMVAALVLLALAAAVTARRGGRELQRPRTSGHRTGLAAVAVIGGAIPFVLFFEGLSRASSTDAAFIHKTLVVWVAVLAVSMLGERLTLAHVAAIALILVGQAEVRGGVGWPDASSGEAMILAATWCWSVEVIVAKRLLTDLSELTVGVARMAGGSVLLIGWATLTGRLGDLASLSATQIGWVLLTGAILALYVVSWHLALARAQAVDVTAVLVLAAVITALLDAWVKGRALAPQVTGLVLIAVGVALAIAAGVGAARSPSGAMAAAE